MQKRILILAIATLGLISYNHLPDSLINYQEDQPLLGLHK